ncbi:hypothetical protein HFN54_36375 [Rhizobium leguminosarum]|nr:hypothetical protein [Rhizobium leguminosarum]
MPVFMIETTYKLPVYRERIYEACSLEHACMRAVLDQNWDDEKANSAAFAPKILTLLGAAKAIVALIFQLQHRYSKLLGREVNVR